MVEEGEVTRAAEYQVGAGIMLGSRLLTGAGYTLKVPAIDLAEVGAGGGSLIWIDAGGALQIGPESAGAVARPGLLRPRRRGADGHRRQRGARLPQPHAARGRRGRAQSDKARASLQAKVADRVGLSVEHAAYGAHLIAASNMIRAIRAVSSERGRDPRDVHPVRVRRQRPAVRRRDGRARSASSASWCRRPLACSRPSACSRPTSSTTIRAASGPCCRKADLAEIERRLRRARSIRRASSSRPRASPASDARIQTIGRAALPGPDLRARRPRPGRRDRRRARRRARGGVRARARADLRPSRRVSTSRSSWSRSRSSAALVTAQAPALPDAAGVVRPSAETQPQPRLAYFGPEHGWLETPVLRRSELSGAAHGPVHRRGVRRDLRGSAGRARRARRRRQHRHRAATGLKRDARPDAATGGDTGAVAAHPTIRGSHITMSGKTQINTIMSSNAITNGAAPRSTSESVPRPRMPWMTNRLMPKGGVTMAV